MLKIEKDENLEMMKITFNGKVIFEGNYWDFDASPLELVNFLKKLKLNVVLEEYEYGE